jgi:glycosyltransferase involved in cell wall biosynthesis
MTSFTVVTACRNAARYIDETVTSVLEQSIFTSGQGTLQYLVYDGASTDDTLARLRPYERHGVTVVSEADGGLYSALAKALPQATGDYVAYLNAGDFLNPQGLGIAADCFALPGVDWLTGLSVTYNERSQLTACSLPFRYLPELIACGAYGRPLPFIQQESTVWRRSLQDTVDFAVLSRLRYAGDAYLWSRFATAASLHVVRGHIGGFRIHRGQLSENLQEYRREQRSFSRPMTVLDRLRCVRERLLMALPQRVSGTVADRSTLILYDHALQTWRKTPYLNP